MKLVILALALSVSACAALGPRDDAKKLPPEPGSPLAQQQAAAGPVKSGAVSSGAHGSTGAVPATPPAVPPAEEYRIGPSDLLEISVFQVKELDRTVRVNSRGLISLPLVGALNAAGMTGNELEDQIAAKLQENYLQNPQVSVFIKEFTSQRVTIEGQVEKAGIFPITGNTTLLQALALAGGVKELAEQTVNVFRLTGEGTRQMLAYDIDRIRAGGIVDPTLKNNDIVVVGKDESRAFVKTIADTLRGFISFGTVR